MEDCSRLVLANTITYRIEGLAWGDVSTRDRMVVTSQEVYKRLSLGSSDPNQLQFDVVARVAVFQDGTLDQDKLKDLILLLRPDRDGMFITIPCSSLTLLWSECLSNPLFPQVICLCSSLLKASIACTKKRSCCERPLGTAKGLIVHSRKLLTLPSTRSWCASYWVR